MKEKLKWNETIKLVLRDYAEALLVAVILAIVIRSFFYSAYKIPTPYMDPTLKVGDFVIASKWEYGFHIPLFNKKILQRKPKRGDVVIFRCVDDISNHCTRRVIGLPGDRIQIIKKRLIINQQVSSYSLNPGNSTSETQGAILVEKLKSASHLIRIESDSLADEYGPVVVPPESLFVLSDFRDGGEDSRDWGVIPINNLVGKVKRVWMSIDWSDTWKGSRGPSLRWERLFQEID